MEHVAQMGFAPMDAKSLTDTAIAFQPTSAGLNRSFQCTDSTRESVVMTEPSFNTAASSPGPILQILSPHGAPSRTALMTSFSNRSESEDGGSRNWLLGHQFHVVLLVSTLCTSSTSRF